MNLGRKLDPAKQKITYYPANAMPVLNDLNIQLVDRKAAVSAARDLETPAAAAARKRSGEPALANYTATAPHANGPRGVNEKPSVYGSNNRPK